VSQYTHDVVMGCTGHAVIFLSTVPSASSKGCNKTFSFVLFARSIFFLHFFLIFVPPGTLEGQKWVFAACFVWSKSFFLFYQSISKKEK